MPRAEHAHWLFAGGFLFLGLVGRSRRVVVGRHDRVVLAGRVDLHGIAVEVGVAEEGGDVAEVHDRKVELVELFVDARAAPDDLLEFDHGNDRTHQYDVADVASIHPGGQFL